MSPTPLPSEEYNPQLCRRRAYAGEVIGDACPDCGHTNLLHPGRQNPAIGACLACEMHGTMYFMMKFMEAEMEEPEVSVIVVDVPRPPSHNQN